jgi:hypothetical protein
VVVAVVGGITALGGFRDVPVKDLPELALGDTHHGNEVDTVITSVFLTTRVPGRAYEADEGTQYLVVTASTLNTKKAAGGLTVDLVRVLIDGKLSANTASEGFIDPRTGANIGFLQPGIPFDAVFYWEVDMSVSTGDELIIGLFDRVARDDPRFSDTAYSTLATARILTTIGAEK